MNDIIIERDSVNLEALDADLRATLGSSLIGVSVTRGIITVHLSDAAPNAAASARQIVLNHDPAKLSSAQQKARDQAAKLDAARSSNTADLDLTPFADPLLVALALKIAWLEQEIIALRSGR